jgi:DNA-binding NtrC family response regulator
MFQVQLSVEKVDVMQKKILVVDDEKMIRDMLEKALTREGYEVICAESAEEALEALKKTTAQVMFLDLKLPGMNGLDLCREIRELYPMSIAYAITGYASLFELSDCRRAGFEGYFTKPVDLKTLFETANDAFEKIKRWQKN